MLKSSYKEGQLEAGCDEAGRGCLAGPVYAAAVILPLGYTNELLNDSKKLTEKQRYALRDEIERSALCFAVASVSAQEIDKINILKASILAMQKALAKLKTQPEYILVDGNRFSTYKNIPYSCIVHGDALYMSIAAASVLAKTYRDDFMQYMNKKCPQYGWAKNKAYPTATHYQAIKDNGITLYHRKSYKLFPDLKLF